MTKANIGAIQVKILSQIGPKIDENGEKCRNINLSQFLALLRPFKATKQLLGVCKMAKGVPLISKNDQNNILVQCKSNHKIDMNFSSLE